MGEILHCAFCQGDQTIRMGKTLLFPKFCMPSKMNQDLMLHQETLLYPIAEYHQIWTRCTVLIRFLDDSGFNVSFVNENG